MRISALAICLLLLFALLLPFTAVAAPDGDGVRFIFNSLEGDGVSLNTDDSLSVYATDETVTLKTEGLFSMGSGGSTNALYISLLNRSSDAVRLTVTYRCNNDQRQHTVTHEFAASAQKETVWLPAPHISTLQSGSEMSFSLSFTGGADENDFVRLYAFYDVSIYDPTEDAIASTVMAEIEQCYYEPGATSEQGQIKISGTIPSIFEDDDSTLALFAFGPNDQDSSQVITKTPVARVPISKSFSFTVSARTAEEIYARYAVAVVTAEGERRLLCQPIYPDIRVDAAPTQGGFKGLHTDSIFTVLDSGIDLEIVDVYLDQLLLSSSDSGDSILYAGDHSYYFFSEAKIAALDHRIQNLTGEGCEVYLRFLVTPGADGLSYVNQADSQTGIVNKGVDIKSEAALLEIHALTDFLTQRYNNTEKGNINGIILGRSADRSSIYSYIGVQSLSSYAEKYATYLNLVAGTAHGNIPGLRMIVPISDRVHTETVLITDLTGDYFSDLFLDSLIAAMEDLILTPPQFSVMLESYEGDTVKQPEDMGNVSDFLTLVNTYSQKHRFLDESILYSWAPSTAYTDEELNAAYAIRYVKLYLNSNVRSFVVDLSLHAAGQNVASRLKYLVSCIDTTRGESILSSIREEYPQAFPQYEAAALVSKQIDRINIGKDGYTSGRTPTGSYTLFDFSQTGGRTDWYAGGNCTELSVIDRALTARMTATSGEEYAEIAYSFGGIKSYAIAPLMRFSLGLQETAETANTLYEVQIRLISPKRTLIAAAVMRAGEEGDLYLDLSRYIANLSELRSIRILARPLSGNDTPYELYLDKVVLESATLTSAELAEQISIQVNESRPNTAPAVTADYTTPIIVSAIVIGSSILLVVILVIRQVRLGKKED